MLEILPHKSFGHPVEYWWRIVDQWWKQPQREPKARSLRHWPGPGLGYRQRLKLESLFSQHEKRRWRWSWWNSCQGRTLRRTVILCQRHQQLHRQMRQGCLRHNSRASIPCTQRDVPMEPLLVPCRVPSPTGLPCLLLLLLLLMQYVSRGRMSLLGIWSHFFRNFQQFDSALLLWFCFFYFFFRTHTHIYIYK